MKHQRELDELEKKMKILEIKHSDETSKLKVKFKQQESELNEQLKKERQEKEDIIKSLTRLLHRFIFIY